METVKTKYGKTINKKNAHKMGSDYYEKNVDVVLIDGRWNRTDNGIIAFDHKFKEWNKKKNLIYGYVLDKKGYFTPDLLKNVVVMNQGVKEFALNEDAALSNGFVDEYCSEYYVPYYKGHDKITINPNVIPKKYGIEITTFKYKSLKSMPYMRDKNLERFLKGIKFGFEFETSNGFIKSKKLSEYGVEGLLDGSLREDGVEPFEYATIPYTQTKGLNYVKEFMSILKTHCEHNYKCSVHINLSGIEVNKSSIVYLYNVLEKIQNDLFKMFSHRRRYSEYCKKLPTFSKDYNFDNTLEFKSYYHDIVSFLGNKPLSNKNNIKNKQHPIQKQKWNIPSRYYFANLNDFYYKKNPRIEFRIHEGCFDFNQIFNWFLMCVKIIKFANKMDYQDLNKDMTLDNVLFRGFYGRELKQYYMERKKKFNQKKEVNYVQF